MITDQRLIQLLMTVVEPQYVLTATALVAGPTDSRKNLEILLVIRDGDYIDFVNQRKSDAIRKLISNEANMNINMLGQNLTEFRIYHQPMNIFSDEISRFHLHPWKGSTNRSALLFWNYGTIIYPTAIDRDGITHICYNYSKKMGNI